MEDHASPAPLTFWTCLFAQFLQKSTPKFLIDKVIGLAPMFIPTKYSTSQSYRYHLRYTQIQSKSLQLQLDQLQMALSS